MSKVKSPNSELLTWSVELLRVAPPEEAERLSSASWDTLQRNHPEWVVQISERRHGMRVGHCLLLGTK
jgi:hypothetical protein